MSGPETPDEGADELEEMDELEELEEAEPTRPVGRGRVRSARERRGGGAGRQPAGARRRSARGGTAGGAGKDRRLLIAGGGVVLLLAVLGFFLLKGDGTTTGNANTSSGTARQPGASSTGGTATEAAEGNDRTPASRSPADQFAARHDALAPADLEGRRQLAGFCEQNGLTRQRRAVLLEILLLDADDATARAEFGFTRYSGPMEAYRGRWLDQRDAELAAEAEQLFH